MVPLTAGKKPIRNIKREKKSHPKNIEVIILIGLRDVLSQF